jgi:Leucine-rich repeat (LRR) protein
MPASKPLTKELIMARCKQDNLKMLKNLNLWGNDLDDVSLLRDMVNIEVLSLSINCISSLRDFSNCMKLQELYLRRNNISDLGEIRHI